MDINASMTTATEQMIDLIGMEAQITSSGVTTTITVLFDNEYQSIDLASGEVGSTGPAAHCKSSDVSGAKQGDTMTINSVSYSVVMPEPDGTGMTTLRLRKT